VSAAGTAFAVWHQHCSISISYQKTPLCQQQTLALPQQPASLCIVCGTQSRVQCAIQLGVPWLDPHPATTGALVLPAGHIPYLLRPDSPHSGSGMGQQVRRHLPAASVWAVSSSCWCRTRSLVATSLGQGPREPVPRQCIGYQFFDLATDHLRASAASSPPTDEEHVAADQERHGAGLLAGQQSEVSQGSAPALRGEGLVVTHSITAGQDHLAPGLLVQQTSLLLNNKYATFVKIASS